MFIDYLLFHFCDRQKLKLHVVFLLPSYSVNSYAVRNNTISTIQSREKILILTRSLNWANGGEEHLFFASFGDLCSPFSYSQILR